MKDLRWAWILILFTIFAVTIPETHAVGLGFYLKFSGGRSDLDVEFDGYFNDGNDLEVDGDVGVTGFGFVLDTAVAKDRIFNYRLNLTVEDVEYDGFGGYFNNYSFDFTRLAMDHSFGFAILRKETVRLWIGPQIRFSVMSGDFNNPISYSKIDVDDVYGFGGGIVLGANIHFGPIVSLCIDTGHRSTLQYGDFDWEFNDGDWDSGDFFGYEGEFFINFSLLFRIQDTFDTGDE